MALPVSLSTRDERRRDLARGEEAVRTRSASYFALRRFARNKLAVFGSVLVLALCILGFGAPIL
ncbi:MAG: hypothetical protein M3490_07895, partial [Chloroflexota bacterium]|nr:hypothetical protein [Chloroflexota bacterium]